MMEYINIIFRTLLFYWLLIVVMRVMGKREVGELGIFDVVVFFLISEIFSMAIQNDEESIWKALIPIAIIALMQVLTSYLILKSEKIRALIDGKTDIIVNKGKINQKAMKKQRYNLDDLFSQMREQGVDSINDIEYAVLETSGKLNIIKSSDAKTLYPLPLIKDGNVDSLALEHIQKDEQWLKEQIHQAGYENFEQIFLAVYETKGMVVVEKEMSNNK